MVQGRPQKVDIGSSTGGGMAGSIACEWQGTDGK